MEITLAPGLNSITVKQLDASAKVTDTRTIEIMYVAAVNNATQNS